ncbi:MAG: VWA domain-containing protein [Fibrobacter sp.]|mgnify:CR=1 FL=1|nr:VWA domain-containing protein [Fibrobacter sp.]
MRYSVLLSLLLSLSFYQICSAVSLDSIGEGTCAGFVPVPADTVKDTSFLEGQTITLPDGSELYKPYSRERSEAVIPSLKTNVKIIAGDGFAHGKVEQVFSNPFDLPFEATYIFPLPNNGAVHAMEFRTGSGVFHASLLEKEAAKEKYEAAKQQGQQASLLMQGQDNIFVQKLCNIPPHDSVKVTITFSMALTYSSGIYELAFPTVVGPRYNPAPLPKRSVNPTYLPPETRSGSSLDFTILIATPYEIDDLSCASHEVSLKRGDLESVLAAMGMFEAQEQLPDGVNPTLVRMTARETIPNKDIVVRFGRKNSGRDVSALSWHDGEQGYFAMSIFPDLIDTATEIPKAVDMTFVIDISGSMSGAPLEKEKEIMRAMIEKARPIDRLSFIAFNTTLSNCFDQPVEATAENLAAARKWIDNLQANGGTEMINGVRQGLSVPLDKDRVRILSLITDGYIGGIDQIYSEIKNDPNGTIAFTFGVGSSVNRELIDAAAAAGSGAAKVILLSDPVGPVMDEFWTRVRAPQLAGISLDWGGEVSDLIPSVIPNLWLGQPVTIFGKYSSGGPRKIVLTAKKDEQTISESYDVYFVENNTFIDFVPKMWARQSIEVLMNEQAASNNERCKDEILSLSLEHDVLCKYTAFLAVADSVVNENGEMISMEIPGIIPEGVDPYMSGAISWEKVTSRGDAYISIKEARLEPLNKKAILTMNARNGVLDIVLRDIDGRKPVHIDIFDMKGRRVGSWRASCKSGELFWSWNFKKSNTSPGMYTVVIRAQNTISRTVILSK